MMIYRECRRLKKTVISKDEFSDENAARGPRDTYRNLVSVRSQGFGPLTLYIIFQTCILITWKYLQKNNQNIITGPET